jgi:type 1 glutamine amidotransferase/nicotinamidase-related amidase
MRHLAILPALIIAAMAHAAEPLRFMTQSRVQETNGAYQVSQYPTDWDPEKTAIIICDMWDQHWCEGATKRVGEMAPRMNEVIEAARKRGVLIIHAPSSTTDFYEGTPARARAKNAPRADMPNDDSWKHLDRAVEGDLPIDDSDGGCDCWPPCEDVNSNVWTRQIETIRIDDNDAISDNGQEVFNVLEQYGRDNVIVMGVHTNMCVLGRPFSIRANVNNGKNVLLMRDLTDTMYNARMAPFVNHHRGTDLVVEHIEKFWAPTITSAAFLDTTPQRFADDDRPHAVFVIHEKEYETDRTVPAFAEAELVQRFGWRCTYLMGDGLHNIPGLEVLEDADLLFVSVRRQVLPTDDLAHIHAYCESGKPVVGIRTASHAFASRKGDTPEGAEEWPEFDPEILGGNYHNHHGNSLIATARVIDGARAHTILDGINTDTFETGGSLYKTSPLADTATSLIMGRVDGHPPEPVAWTNINRYGGRVFYTSLGHVDDFVNPDFRRLLVNGIVWTLAE